MSVRARCADLVLDPRDGDPLAQVAAADLVGPAGHPLDGTHGAPGDRPPAQRRERQARRPADEQQHEDPVARAVDLGERLGGAPARRTSPSRRTGSAVTRTASAGRPARRDVVTRPPASTRASAGGSSSGAPGHAVALRQHDAPVAPQDLGARAALAGHGQDGARDVVELGRPLRVVAERDLVRRGPQRPVELGGQVGAQARDDEGAEGDEDRREHERVPRGQPGADRRAPHGGSTT